MPMVGLLSGKTVTAAVDSDQIWLNDKDQKAHIVGCALERSLLCTISLLDGVDCQDMGGSSAQLESELLIRHVTADSFRTFTIVAENEVSTTLRAVTLLTRGRSA